MHTTQGQAASGGGGNSGQKSVQLCNYRTQGWHPPTWLPGTLCSPHSCSVGTVLPSLNTPEASPALPPSSTLGCPFVIYASPCAGTVIKIWWGTSNVSLLSWNGQNCYDRSGDGGRRPQKSKEKCILGSQTRNKSTRH